MKLEDLERLVENGETEESLALAGKLLEEGADPSGILARLTETMSRVGERFARLDIFLPEVMLAGEAMSAVVELVRPRLLAGEQQAAKGRVVIGVVRGDLHEIGKNIVKLMLETHGFEVRDLGYDVDSLDFIREAEAMGADFIGASALMTTTMPRQQEIIDFLKDKGLRDKYRVVIGGAPTSQAWAERIGADLYCEDANSAPRLMAALLDGRPARQKA